MRAHAAVRSATCPLDTVVDAVAGSTRVLEVGCGYGLVAAMLAAADSRRHVVGVDIDSAKVAGAAAIVANVRRAGGDLTIDLAGPDASVGPWDAIVVVDVLYLFPPDQQAGAVAEWAQMLAPGGVLAVKEMAGRPRWKARWNLAQERLAVRTLRWTSGAAIAPPTPDAVRSWMTAAGLSYDGRRLDRGYLHPHFLHLGRRRA